MSHSLPTLRGLYCGSLVEAGEDLLIRMELEISLQSFARLLELQQCYAYRHLEKALVIKWDVVWVCTDGLP